MKLKKVIVFLIVVGVVIIFLYSENNAVTVTYIDYKSGKLPGQFNGYRIVHLSDIHNKQVGGDFWSNIESAQPDLIFITGDLVDSRDYNEQNAVDFASRCVEIAPVFYVNGNHDQRSGMYGSLEGKLVKSGVRVLRNDDQTITRGNDAIQILGIDAPSFPQTAQGIRQSAAAEHGLKQALQQIDSSRFTILLSHHPEKFNLYIKYEIDLIFSGHAHGGQIRLPFIGGVYAPDQGFFPKYTSGKYEMGASTMIVSRGIGNSIFPQRLFNRPEIVVVTLYN